MAGQHWKYTAKQRENFKSGKRKSTAMVGMVAKLTPDEMVALGKFFEKQKVEAEPPKDAGLAAVGKYIYNNGNKFGGLASCASCHGAEAKGTTALTVWLSSIRPIPKPSSNNSTNESAPMTTL